MAAARRDPLALSLAVLAGLMLVQFVNLYRKGFGLTFHYDEWNWVLNRRGWSAGALLDAHNEHLVVVPVLVFKTLFVTVGIDSYAPYRVAVILVHLAVVGLVFVLVRRRIGDVLALAAAALVLFLGSAWQNLLWPFQVGYLMSVAAGLGMLVALDRRDLAGHVAACILLAVSLGSGSLGIPFACIALVDLLLGGEGRWRSMQRWRRVWVVTLPTALYLLWLVGYGNLGATPGQAKGIGLFAQNGPAMAGYMAEMAAAAFAGLAGLSVEFGRTLAVLAAVVLAVAIARRGYVSPRAASLAAGLAAFWGLTALLRAQLAAPTDSRYVYPAAVLIVLLAAELLRGHTVVAAAGVVAAAVVVFAAAGNYGALRAGSLHLQDWASHLRAELGALEIAGPTAPPHLAPDPVRAPDITADRYFAAVRQLGSPGDTPDEIRLGGPTQRQAADVVLAAALEVALQPGRAADGSAALELQTANALDADQSDSCVRLRATGEGAFAVVAVPENGLVVEEVEGAPVEVRLRSFADDFPVAAGTIEAGQAALLRIPQRPGITWHAQVLVPEQARVCGAQ